MFRPPFVLRSRLLSEDEGFTSDPRVRYATAREKREWIDFGANFRPANRRNREARFQKDLEILKVMHKSGVPILAGTDLGNPYIFAGFSLHDELAAFVAAGFRPIDALRTATINPAKYMGLEHFHGTIQKGRSGDLVLLDANPLENIANIGKINAVVVKGQLLRRADLDALLESAAAAARP